MMLTMLTPCVITGLGYCPYNELMEFLSLATSGAYLPRVPETRVEAGCSEPRMNLYHEAFLAWSFRKCLDGINLGQHLVVQSDKVVSYIDSAKRTILAQNY